MRTGFSINQGYLASRKEFNLAQTGFGLWQDPWRVDITMTADCHGVIAGRRTRRSNDDPRDFKIAIA